MDKSPSRTVDPIPIEGTSFVVLSQRDFQLILDELEKSEEELLVDLKLEPQWLRDEKGNSGHVVLLDSDFWRLEEDDRQPEPYVYYLEMPKKRVFAKAVRYEGEQEMRVMIGSKAGDVVESLGDKAGILHVKCAVADGTWLFLSSANLTEYAFTINMELGTLIRGSRLPVQAESHFDSLIAQGVLLPI